MFVQKMVECIVLQCDPLYGLMLVADETKNSVSTDICTEYNESKFITCTTESLSLVLLNVKLIYIFEILKMCGCGNMEMSHHI